MNLTFKMNLKVNSVEELLQSNICRCCLKSDCFGDITMDCYSSGRSEIHEDMLKNTFNIQLSQEDIEGCVANAPVICADCVMKIRDAFTFKQMVLHNKDEFIELVKRLKNSDREAKGGELKLEQIKSESSPVMEYDDNTFEDDEVLANIKLELSQNDAILDPLTTTYTDTKKTSMKKCKIKSDTGNQKDWSKIAERRGNGPILRENSLKLLANSTIFVFQWNKSRYRCFCCKEPFSDVDLLRQHTRTSHDLKTIEKKIINQQNRLVKVEISDLKCSLCHQNFENLDFLREHLTRCHNIKFESTEHLLVPFKIGGALNCQICNEKFNVFRLLNIHMNKHFQKQVCHICGAGFSNLVFLNLHKTRLHKPLTCRHCDVNFANKTDKKHHEITVHNVKFERKLRFPCPYCSERFYQENFRVQHLVEKHGLKRPEFRCDICSKVFITKSLCNNHLKNVHLKEKSHECEVCHNFFYTKSDVTRHKVTHTGEKNYSCTMCNNPFASKDSLRRHMRRTHGVH